MTYYCIGCGQSHEQGSRHVVFRTAFHYEPDGEKLHVGLCPKHPPQLAETHKHKQAG